MQRIEERIVPPFSGASQDTLIPVAEMSAALLEGRHAVGD
jgi:hypothetical protein